MEQATKYKVGDRVRLKKSDTLPLGWVEDMRILAGTVVEIIHFSSEKDVVWGELFQIKGMDNSVWTVWGRDIEPQVDAPDKNADLIAEAKRRYPIGTKFIPVHFRENKGNPEYVLGVYDHNTLKVENDFISLYGSDQRNINGYVGVLYKEGIWAEIVGEVTTSEPASIDATPIESPLEKAKRLYPPGTTFIAPDNGKTYTVWGEYSDCSCGILVRTVYNNYQYVQLTTESARNGRAEWAETVSTTPAKLAGEEEEVYLGSNTMTDNPFSTPWEPSVTNPDLLVETNKPFDYFNQNIKEVNKSILKQFKERLYQDKVIEYLKKISQKSQQNWMEPVLINTKTNKQKTVV